VITIVSHNLAPGGNVVVARPFYDGFTGNRWQGGGDGLQAAYRSGAGSIGLIKENTLLSKGIKLGGQDGGGGSYCRFD
jgi:hypothetical protein